MKIKSLGCFRSMILAFGLIMGGIAMPAISAEGSAATTAAPLADSTHASAKKEVPWVDGRTFAIGLGVLGGLAVYGLLRPGWGMGPGAMRAMRWGGGFMGGRMLPAAVFGIVGAWVGDWIYRSNKAAETP